MCMKLQNIFVSIKKKTKYIFSLNSHESSNFLYKVEKFLRPHCVLNSHSQLSLIFVCPGITDYLNLRP